MKSFCLVLSRIGKLGGYSTKHIDWHRMVTEMCMFLILISLIIFITHNYLLNSSFIYVRNFTAYYLSIYWSDICMWIYSKLPLQNTQGKVQNLKMMFDEWLLMVPILAREHNSFILLLTKQSGYFIMFNSWQLNVSQFDWENLPLNNFLFKALS